MSSIVGALTGGGDSGMNFRAKQADIINPVTQAQTDQAYTQTQAGLGNQQAFLQAVQNQNGLGNQSQVFNQLQGVASGTGPNPAQAQLAQATGANTANQAALMAGQRGSSSNVGLMARQAAMQGGQNQQNAAGQAATLQANQSMNALNSMGSLATNQANQQAAATNAYTNSALSQQQNLLGGVGAYNNAAVNMQSNMNNANAGMAGNVATQQGNTMGNMMGAAGSAAQLLGGGATDDVGGEGEDLEGLAGEMGWAKGGMIPKRYASGGAIIPDGSTPLQSIGPQSNVGKSFMDSQDAMGASDPSLAMPQAAMAKKGGGGPQMPNMQQMVDLGGKALNWFGHGISDAGEWLGGGVTGALSAGGTAVGGAMAGAGEAAGVAAPAVLAAAKGGKVAALVSPGEKYLKPNDVEQVKKGANPMQVGEKIPGKPKVAGAKNSYANDFVPKQLDEGGIVLPRSVTQAKNPGKAAADFVAAVMKKESLKKGK